MSDSAVESGHVVASGLTRPLVGTRGESPNEWNDGPIPLLIAVSLLRGRCWHTQSMCDTCAQPAGEIERLSRCSYDMVVWDNLRDRLPIGGNTHTREAHLQICMGQVNLDPSVVENTRVCTSSKAQNKFNTFHQHSTKTSPHGRPVETWKYISKPAENARKQVSTSKLHHQMSTNFQHLFHTLDAVCASTCFKIRSPVGQHRVCNPHSGTLRDHAIHGRPQLIFNRLDRSTRFAKSSSGMSMRKGRVLMSTILFIVFTCFFRSPTCAPCWPTSTRESFSTAEMSVVEQAGALWYRVRTPCAA